MGGVTPEGAKPTGNSTGGSEADEGRSTRLRLTPTHHSGGIFVGMEDEQESNISHATREEPHTITYENSNANHQDAMTSMVIIV
ncbi:hypothetical protein GUJ93_ZPchr0010g10800 [Zizania palustris]|uniref:Uncharacterized protein n=1 Tax=Zizania palustris TaxID=103762 RepID=A0A8J5TIJ7_ZIZPA|nr:hypothetical protein GUJ93_ZPchr0010g10800 [Zizania palustris]